jgi:hypothetical protein
MGIKNRQEMARDHPEWRKIYWESTSKMDCSARMIIMRGK